MGSKKRKSYREFIIKRNISKKSRTLAIGIMFTYICVCLFSYKTIIMDELTPWIRDNSIQYAEK